jgi:hypothetical protein
MVSTEATSIAVRVDALDWSAVARDLDTVGIGLTGRLLHDAECGDLIDGYATDAQFRSTIDMARYRFGQRRPTPLILRYGPGDWNALHRDIYGACVFPLQVIIALDRHGVSTVHTGGRHTLGLLFHDAT